MADDACVLVAERMEFPLQAMEGAESCPVVNQLRHQLHPAQRKGVQKEPSDWRAPVGGGDWMKPPQEQCLLSSDTHRRHQPRERGQYI